jgi:hypothetical protein
MKRIYNFITKANQVLLFLVLVGCPILIWYLFQCRGYEPAQVPVAQSAEEAKESVVKDVRFLGQSSGIYVFGIVKHIVRKEPSRNGLLASASLGNEELRSGEIVNVSFSRGEQRLRTLLQNDGLILSENVDRDNKFKALLFNCITEDTDGNHRLDVSDRNDLYIVSEDLDKPDFVIKGALEFRVTSATHLLVKTQEDLGLRFWDVDVEASTKKEVAWK